MELMKREEQWQLTVVVDVVVDKIDYGNGCSGATITYGHKNFLNYKAWSFVPFRGLALVRNSPVQERKKELKKRERSSNHMQTGKEPKQYTPDPNKLYIDSATTYHSMFCRIIMTCLIILTYKFSL